MSHFAELPAIQADPAFSLIAACEADEAVDKVDLCPGFYRDENAKPWILPSVAQAKLRIHADPTISHEHLPLTGHPGLVRGSQKLLFGSERDLSRVASLQTVSGTGANHIAAEFIAAGLKPKTVWISNPSWINHTEIWKLSGPEVTQKSYPYYEQQQQKVDFVGLITTLRNEAQKGDVIIIHACAHNPTGADLTNDQWKTIAEICKDIGLFAVFDVAYQGFASGDLDQDAFGITQFYDQDLEFSIAQSFSKNFRLYGERIGMVHVIARDAEIAGKITPILTRISRAEITSCPSYGARIVAEILEDPELHDQWLRDLVTMSDRMKAMRRDLYKDLQRRNVPGHWEHLLSDIGMFSMTGLSREQVVELREKCHIYLLPSGRLSVTGLTKHNVSLVAAGFHAVLSR